MSKRDEERLMMRQVGAINEKHILEADYTEEELEKLKDTGALSAVSKAKNNSEDGSETMLAGTEAPMGDDLTDAVRPVRGQKGVNYLPVAVSITLIAAAVLLFIFFWNPDRSQVISTTEDSSNNTTQSTEALTEAPTETSTETSAETPTETQELSEEATDADRAVLINETNFPDATFRNSIREWYDKNRDGRLDEEEIYNLTDINVNNMNISDLKGIEWFPRLVSLNCTNTDIRTLDVSRNTDLRHLYCGANWLSELDLSANTALSTLECSGCKLTSLDISHNIKLKTLDCSSNKLETLDVSQNILLFNLKCFSNTHLHELDFSGNPLLVLRLIAGGFIREPYMNLLLDPKEARIDEDAAVSVDAENFPDAAFRAYVEENFDVDKNGKLDASEIENATQIRVKEQNIKDLKGIEHLVFLELLECPNNQLTKLDLSRNPELRSLACSGNLLTSLNLSANTKLSWLECNGNLLEELDVSNNPGLNYIRCVGNRLTSLDFSSCELLEWLYCSENRIETLNLGNIRWLYALDCHDNLLTELDLSKCTDLNSVWCQNNRLKKLDVHLNTDLSSIYCSNNEITTLDLSANSWMEDLKCDVDVVVTGRPH